MACYSGNAVGLYSGGGGGGVCPQIFGKGGGFQKKTGFFFF